MRYAFVCVGNREPRTFGTLNLCLNIYLQAYVYTSCICLCFVSDCRYLWGQLSFKVGRSSTINKLNYHFRHNLVPTLQGYNKNRFVKYLMETNSLPSTVTGGGKNNVTLRTLHVFKVVISTDKRIASSFYLREHQEVF